MNLVWEFLLGFLYGVVVVIGLVLEAVLSEKK